MKLAAWSCAISLFTCSLARVSHAAPQDDTSTPPGATSSDPAQLAPPPSLPRIGQSPELQRLVEDDFESDTLADYASRGKGTWASGRVTLAETASLERTIGPTHWFQLRTQLEPPAASTEQELRFWFNRTDAADCYARIRVEHRDDTFRGSAALVYVSESDGVVDESMIRQSTFVARSFHDLSCEYRHGFFRITLNDNPLLLAAVAEEESAVHAFRIESATGSTTVLAITAWGDAADEQDLDESQLQRLARAGNSQKEMLALFRQGKMAEAEKIAAEIVAVRHSILGKRHPETLGAMNDLAVIRSRVGDLVGAIDTARKVVETRRDLLGELHPVYAGALNNLGIFLKDNGEFTEGGRLIEQAASIRKAVLGAKHPSYVANLDALVSLYMDSGDLGRARPIAEQSLELKRDLFGENHPEYARSLGTLAGWNLETGRYARAEQLFLQTLPIYEQAFGKQHPSYANCLNNLGGLYYELGDYQRAQAYYRQSLVIIRSLNGENNPAYANTLSNLAGACMADADFVQAEPLLKAATEIRKAIFGVQHPQYAISLNNLAVLYGEMGDFETAYPVQKESLDITETVFGTQHPEYARKLVNLARIENSLGNSAVAMQLNRQAVEIHESLYGKQHPAYIHGLSQLAGNYQEAGKLDQALAMREEVLANRRDTYGTRSLAYTSALSNLAGLLIDMGRIEQARQYFDEMLKIDRDLVGVDHPEFAKSLHNVAMFRSRIGQYDQAEPLFQQAMQLVFEQLENQSIIQSERQQHRNQLNQRAYFNGYLTNAVNLNTAADMTDVVETVWRWKGAVTDRQRAYRTIASDPGVSSLFAELQLVSRELSAWTKHAPNESTAAANPKQPERTEDRQRLWRQRFEELTRQREALEKQIASQSAEYRYVRQPVKLETICSFLPRDAALVDFIEYVHGTNSDGGRTTEYENRYCAFIVKPDGSVQLVGLGPADPIRLLIDRFRSSLTAVRRDERVAGRAAAAELRRRLWEPLEAHLAACDPVIISPDTALGSLPFAALPGQKADHYLIEEVRLATIPMARMIPIVLAEPASASDPLDRGILVVGDIDYDTRLPGDSPAQDGLRLAAEPVDDELVATRATTAQRWKPLAGFRTELAAISQIFQESFKAQPRTLRGAQATESGLLGEMTDYGFIHIVTHGYFKPADTSTTPQPNPTDSRSSTDLVNSWMPGLLAGLVMAGANQSTGTQERFDDGILHASEIETASLPGVDLVVLSACETGLGAVAGGEGLTGLQRAFQMAGARSVVASLWKVEDTATGELMKRFYKNLWHEKMSKLDALQEAQLWLLRHPDELQKLGVTDSTRGTIEDLPSPATTQPGSSTPTARTSPLFWAAFQLSGDWR